MRYRPRIRVAVFIALCSAVWLPRADCRAATQAFVVNETFGGRLWRLADLNGDGDALDAGERSLWADGFAGSLWGMASEPGAVYVTEQGLPGGSRVMRLVDLNGDGDALDAGERTVWLDGLSDINGIARGAVGDWFVSDPVNNQIWRAVDLNGDGDVLDTGERTLYATGITSPRLMLAQSGVLIVPSSTLGGPIHRLLDLNGDGDALDAGESLIITPGYDFIQGLLDDGAGGFFFAAYNHQTVYHAKDRNGDGDFLDTAEVLSYADPVFSGMLGPVAMATHSAGGFLLTDFDLNRVIWVRDANGDHDALDFGEARLFADGIFAPADIVPLMDIIFPPPGLVGDLNADGFVGISDLNIVLSNWNQNVTPGVLLEGDPSGDGFVGIADLNTVLGNWNAGTPPFDSANIPEPGTVGVLGLFGLAVLGSRGPVC